MAAEGIADVIEKRRVYAPCDPSSEFTSPVIVAAIAVANGGLLGKSVVNILISLFVVVCGRLFFTVLEFAVAGLGSEIGIMARWAAAPGRPVVCVLFVYVLQSAVAFQLAIGLLCILEESVCVCVCVWHHGSRYYCQGMARAGPVHVLFRPRHESQSAHPCRDPAPPG